MFGGCRETLRFSQQNPTSSEVVGIRCGLGHPRGCNSSRESAITTSRANGREHAAPGPVAGREAHTCTRARLERVFWQGTLFGTENAPHIDRTFAALERIALDSTSWLDVAPGWLTGADHVFDALASGIEWHQRIVTMYERTLPEPRLTSWWREGSDEPRPLPIVDGARQVLSARATSAASTRSAATGTARARTLSPGTATVSPGPS